MHVWTILSPGLLFSSSPSPHDSHTYTASPLHSPHNHPDAHRSLSQASGATTPTTTAPKAGQVRVEAPQPESVLVDFEDVLTPSTEAMDAASALIGQLNNPQQLSSWVTQNLNQPDGFAFVAATFADLISRGQTMQLAMALSTLNPQQQGGVQGTTTPGTTTIQPYQAYAAALTDQMSRGNTVLAGEALYWALSGAGGSALAQAVSGQMDALQLYFGCSDPVRATLREAGMFASKQPQAQQGGGVATTPMPTTTTMPTAGGAGGAQPSGGASVGTMVAWLNANPSLKACFSEAYPNAQSLLSSGGGGGSGGGTTAGGGGASP